MIVKHQKTMKINCILIRKTFQTCYIMLAGSHKPKLPADASIHFKI